MCLRQNKTYNCCTARTNGKMYGRKIYRQCFLITYIRKLWCWRIWRIWWNHQTKTKAIAANSAYIFYLIYYTEHCKNSIIRGALVLHAALYFVKKEFVKLSRYTVCSYQLLFPDALRLLASCKCLLIAMVMAWRHNDSSPLSITIL